MIEKIYLAPDVVLSYLIGTNPEAERIFDLIEMGEYEGVISNLTWYETLASVKEKDNLIFSRLGRVAFICNFMSFPDDGTIKEEVGKIRPQRIYNLRQLAGCKDKKLPGPDLTCFVCKKDLIEPKEVGGVWKCPDETCDSHLGDE